LRVEVEKDVPLKSTLPAILNVVSCAFKVAGSILISLFFESEVNRYQNFTGVQLVVIQQQRVKFASTP